MFHKYLLPLIAIGLLGLAAAHVAKSQQTPPKLNPIVEPSKNPFSSSIAGSGIVEPRSENISIGSHLPGVVAEVFVNVGDQVRAGDRLLRLDDRQLNAEYAVRSANLSAAEAQLKRLRDQPRAEEIPPLKAKYFEAQANLDNARDLYNRAQRLAKTGAIGEEELITKRNAVAVSEAQLQKAEADLKLTEAGAWEPDKLVAQRAVDQSRALLMQTKIELERNVVNAPISGQILQKNVRPGEYVGIPPSQALFIMGDTSTLHIRMDVDENDLTRFKPGLPAKAFRRGDPQTEISLSFVRIEPYVIPKKSLTGSGSERVDTRVLQVIYKVAEKSVPLYIGQQLDVYVDASQK
ncbi:efflux RND transporter periplasmic adaptor subunit [Telmatocola sphagniphila]|uniref:Efflux RND transporter periplasmic adaptor subunit n=1 Tax=Telmatocola sphagniphila TaxID=1123043 RepID=A0A8E6EWP9_9BACT|nr:HlyD family efflux transporter periplasmic adaptor subunit [Telmatocola sphagniphila]QVL30386.1 efflux RND transporter periplasmic adaptor subunit [Telmatocola sphagniphila]